MSERQTITRKLQLCVVGNKEEKDEVYQYLRDAMDVTYKAMNEYISALYVATILEASKEDRAELNRLFTRISTSKKGSAYTKDFQFPTGLPLASSIGQEIKSDFKKSMRDGLMFGKVSLPTYKKGYPIPIHVDYVRLRSKNPHIDNGLYHDYENHQEFLDHLHKGDAEILLKFAHGITFQLVLGSPKKSAEIRSVLQNVFEENYLVQGSSIQFAKDGKKIILNLSLSIPKRGADLDENTVVGVDLGLAIPAMCALNNSKYIKKSLGSKDDFLRVRTRLQAQRRQLQRHLKAANGGHGRKQKLKALDKLTARERNFVKSYNHFISKNVVEFALDNNAKYINLEDLRKEDMDKYILRNWSYYELQQQITYKAAIYGIEVRKINPYHTSQVCSCCGHYEEGQRTDQAHFKCAKCGEELNADYNAARNIAMSTDFK